MSLALEKKKYIPLPEFSLLVELLAWQACFPVGTVNLRCSPLSHLAIFLLSELQFHV